MFWNFLIFGNGHGMAGPFFDQKFYWLSGRVYTWLGGLGAQLTSFEWRCPQPGTRRKIAGRHFRVFNTHRGYLRIYGFRILPLKWSVSWAMEKSGAGSLDDEHAAIRALKRDIDENLILMGGTRKDK